MLQDKKLNKRVQYKYSAGVVFYFVCLFAAMFLLKILLAQTDIRSELLSASVNFVAAFYVLLQDKSDSRQGFTGLVGCDQTFRVQAERINQEVN